jgi:hypothetical protein
MPPDTLTDIDRALELFLVGNYRKAVATLRHAEVQVGFSRAEAHDLLELATAIRECSIGRVRRNADALVGHAKRQLDHPDWPD